MSTIIRLKRKCSDLPLGGFFIAAKAGRKNDDKMDCAEENVGLHDVKERVNVEHIGERHYLFRYAGSRDIDTSTNKIDLQQDRTADVKKKSANRQLLKPNLKQQTCQALRINAEYGQAGEGRKREHCDSDEVYLEQKRFKPSGGGEGEDRGSEHVTVVNVGERRVVRVYDVEKLHAGESATGSSSEDGYCYDIYQLNQDMMVGAGGEGEMYITPFYGDFTYSARNEPGDDSDDDVDPRINDDSDSNDENNWRNDYPDRDYDAPSSEDSGDDEYVSKFGKLNVDRHVSDDDADADADADESDEQYNFNAYKKRLLKELELDKTTNDNIDHDALDEENYGFL